MLTEQEHAALDKLSEAINALGELPVCHPSDWTEMVSHFHAIQNCIMARSAVRSHPDLFLHYEEFHPEGFTVESEMGKRLEVLLTTPGAPVYPGPKEPIVK